MNTLSIVPKAPNDLAERVRRVADAIDRGEIVDLVMAYAEDGEYTFEFGTGLAQGIVLTTLLQSRAVDRFRR